MGSHLSLHAWAPVPDTGTRGLLDEQVEGLAPCVMEVKGSKETSG